MAYIAPNSTVYILKGVSLDSDYNHTGYFASAAAQELKFVSYRKYTLTEQTYQRVNKERIRVSIVADNLYDCNYMMFQNTNFGSKWFYAFIDKVDYINNSCSEITYTIDVMQTWNFDYELGQCFVEREHVSDDTIGKHTVPENFEMGEKLEYMSYTRNFTRYFAAIITDITLPYIPLLSDPTPYQYHLSPQGDRTKGISGIPNGCYMYMGIPVSKTDVDNFWSLNYSSYDMQDYKVYDYNSSTVNTYLTSTQPLTLTALLDCIRNVMVTVSLDNIIGIYLYPAEFSLRSMMSTAENSYGYSYGTVLQEDAVTVARPTTFYSGYDYSTYTPVNNKLFTYPYIDIKVSNNEGSERLYQFERFQASVGSKFNLVGIQNNATVTLFPRNYNFAGNSINEGVSTSLVIPLPIRSNAFDSWIQTQKYGAASGLIGGALHSGVSIAGGIATGNPISVAGGAVSLISNVLNTVGNLMDMQNVPDQITGNVMNGSLNVATKRVGYRVCSRTIKAEYAKIIDDYFSMFGYAVRTVKVPAIRSTTEAKRRSWNYIQTKGCIIHAAANKGLPADDEKKIAQIYDKGITFWMNLDNVGNYSLTNTVQT